MTRTPHNSILFGQRDRKELRVDPQRGKVGTQFHFNAFHFEPRKSVRVVIQGPRNFIVYSGSIATDDDGSINYFGLSYTASGDWPLGTYTFSVDGLSTKFTLTR